MGNSLVQMRSEAGLSSTELIGGTGSNTLKTLIKYLGFLEKGVIALELMFLTGVRGSFLFIVLYPVIVLLIIWHWKSIVRIGTREKPLWLFIGLVLVSVLWSAAPKVTLTRSFLFVATTLFGLYLAARYSLNEQLRLLAWGLGLQAILSFVFALAVPQQGIMHGLHEGAWQGIQLHKNHLGRHMVISAIVFLLLAISSRGYRWLLWCGFSLSLLLIVLSTSKTALVILVIPLAVLPFYRALRWSYSWMVPFLISVILVGGSAAVLFMANAEPILNALGKDITLTGRTELWSTLLDKVWQRPWFGYGYGGFWLGWAGESADIWLITGWKPPHAHNGFLDILIALGLVGLLVFGVVYVTAVSRAVSWVRSSKSDTGFWHVLYLTLLFLVNLTESTFTSRTIFWALYVATIFSTHINPDSNKEKNTYKIHTN